MIKQALFIYPSHSSFVKIDEQILGTLYRLSSYNLRQNDSKFTYLHKIIKAIAILLRGKYEAVFIWFADYHSFPLCVVARILRRKSIIFIGGYDAVYYPELGMGVHHKRLRSLANRLALQICDLIIANHSSLFWGKNTYYHTDGHIDGILRFVPHLKTSREVIPNGINMNLFPSANTSSERKGILSVGTTPRFEDIVNKGFDLLIEVARQHPQWQICIIGISPCWFPRLQIATDYESIDNLTILPPMPQEQLYQYYQSNKVYVQASISEGMPNALIEAICMGCIPVGSKVSAIPELLGNHGVVINQRGVSYLAEAISNALAMELEHSYIVDFRKKYSIAQRADRLEKVLRKYGLL